VQVLTVAVVHAARASSVDLSAYLPACQSSLNADTAAHHQQVRASDAVSSLTALRIMLLVLSVRLSVCVRPRVIS